MGSTSRRNKENEKCPAVKQRIDKTVGHYLPGTTVSLITVSLITDRC
jgi:hypothetical protein